MKRGIFRETYLNIPKKDVHYIIELISNVLPGALTDSSAFAGRVFPAVTFQAAASNCSRQRLLKSALQCTAKPERASPYHWRQ